MSHVPSPADAAPRAAYVHVPFCRHRCGYCNFTVVAGRDDLFEDYLRAIEIELHGLGQPQPVDTLFCGGGTPTQRRSSRSSFQPSRSGPLMASGRAASLSRSCLSSGARAAPSSRNRCTSFRPRFRKPRRRSCQGSTICCKCEIRGWSQRQSQASSHAIPSDVRSGASGLDLAALERPLSNEA